MPIDTTVQKHQRRRKPQLQRIVIVPCIYNKRLLQIALNMTYQFIQRNTVLQNRKQQIRLYLIQKGVQCFRLPIRRKPQKRLRPKHRYVAFFTRKSHHFVFGRRVFLPVAFRNRSADGFCAVQKPFQLLLIGNLKCALNAAVRIAVFCVYTEKLHIGKVFKNI